jgi:hypothetical protein
VLRATDGNITRNTEATLPMGTGKRQISLVVRVRVELVAIAQAAEPELETVLVAAELGIAQVLAAAVLREVEPVTVPVEALEQEIVRVEVLGQEIVQAAVLELGIVPVVERELGIGPAAAGPVPGHPRAQLAVPPRTKSVIVARRRGLVAVPRVEDLAVEAETTREPAAPGAVRAWAVAVTVVAAADIAVAVE